MKARVIVHSSASLSLESVMIFQHALPRAFSYAGQERARANMNSVTGKDFIRNFRRTRLLDFTQSAYDRGIWRPRHSEELLQARSLSSPGWNGGSSRDSDSGDSYLATRPSCSSSIISARLRALVTQRLSDFAGPPVVDFPQSSPRICVTLFRTLRAPLWRERERY